MAVAEVAAGMIRKGLLGIMGKSTMKLADVISFNVSLNVSNDRDINMERVPKTKEWTERMQNEHENEGNPEKLEVEVPEEVKKEIEAYVKSTMPCQFIPLCVGGVIFQFLNKLSEDDKEFLKEILSGAGAAPEWDDEEFQKAQENVNNIMNDWVFDYTFFEDMMEMELAYEDEVVNPEMEKWVRSFAESINLLYDAPLITGYAFY